MLRFSVTCNSQDVNVGVHGGVDVYVDATVDVDLDVDEYASVSFFNL